MNTTNDIATLLHGNPYPGRGIVIGNSEDGTKACTAYFIMGRSENSRNRIFVFKNGELSTAPFDVSKVEDPRLIIYTAVKQVENNLIVTNGDQTDTIAAALGSGISFADALKTRKFEPDKPHFTPRISGMLTFENGSFHYQMSILKSADSEGSACERFFFSYPALPGTGHLIHTYACDGNPLPSFYGEPKAVKIDNDMQRFADTLWHALDEKNKISLFVRYVDLGTLESKELIFNKQEQI